MSRFRLISLCLLAALALGAVVLAPAGAEEPKKCGVPSPTHWAFCYGSNNEEIGKPVQDVSGTGSKAVLAATIGAAEAKFECKEVSFAAELEPEGKGAGAVTLHKCKETKPAFCKLTEAEEKEIKLYFSESLIGKVEKPGKPEAQLTGTGSGEEVGILYVEHETSECSIVAAGYKVTGKQDLELPHAEESLSEHELVAKKTGSYLKIGENEASLSSTLKVKLSSTHEGATWYIGLGK
jgi:hypothetical protein